MICEYYNHISKVSSVDLDMREVLDRIEKARINARKEMASTD